MIQVYRLHKSIYSPNQGIGAWKAGGRWTPKGMHAIYAAQSRALATLEVLVHHATIPVGFSITSIRIPPGVPVYYKETALPSDWKENLLVTQAFGHNHLCNKLVISVPSAIIPKEWNFIFNTEHPEFHRIRFLESVPFAFDPRLKSAL